MQAEIPVMMTAFFLLAGCAFASGDEDSGGVPLDQGLWRISTTFGTPRVDGLSIDRLRDRLPADKTETKCFQPRVRSGKRIVELVNLKQDGCDLEKAMVANGQISGEGLCPGLAKDISSASSDSWIKIKGTYAPRYVDIDIDVVLTATGESGATARLTATGKHKAEKIGECTS